MRNSSHADLHLAHNSAFASIIVCEAILIGLWFANHGDVGDSRVEDTFFSLTHRGCAITCSTLES